MSSAFDGRPVSTPQELAAISERECARFHGRNLRQPGSGKRVHVVELRHWEGVRMPVPACGQPIDPLRWAGRNHAVAESVTCKRCLARDEKEISTLVTVDYHQLALDLELDS